MTGLKLSDDYVRLGDKVKLDKWPKLDKKRKQELKTIRKLLEK